jgi:hypothetical protein
MSDSVSACASFSSRSRAAAAGSATALAPPGESAAVEPPAIVNARIAADSGPVNCSDFEPSPFVTWKMSPFGVDCFSTPTPPPR